MKEYKIGQRVDAVVEKVLPFGVFARLDDDTRGYIRRRELDLDADVEPSQVVQEGDGIEAVILNLGEPGKYIELSRRAILKNPWPEFARQHRAGDIIRGEVRALHPKGVFVRIQPGINGFVSLEELAPKVVKKPEEVLWVGDDIEAVIKSVQPVKKRISLSIKARLQQYDQAMDTSAQLKSPKAMPKAAQSEKRGIIAPQEMEDVDLKNAGPILIVEDDREVSEALETWFRQKGIEVSAADKVTQSIIEKLASFRVFLIDLNLSESDGLELIQRFHQDDCKAYVCIMSSPENLVARAAEIEAARIAQVFEKPLDLDEVERFLFQAARGERLPVWQAKPQQKVDWSGMTRLQGLGIRHRERLQAVLKEITELIRAQAGIIFWLDPSSHVISIAARDGNSTLNAEAMYGLNESPVADIIHEGRYVFETHVTANVRTKFAKLLDLLPFESCIGVPVPLQGEIHHAAFFFHSDVNAFSHYRVRDARAGALLLSALLMDGIIQERLRALNPLLLSGELAASFGHDVSNKISALEMEARNLVDFGVSDNPGRTQKALKLTQDLKDTVLAFRQMLETKTQETQINVERILMQAMQLLQDMARKEHVRVIFKSEPDLPFIICNSTLLQQIFLNIMLNAIQQMVVKAKQFEWDGQRILEIITALKKDHVQVRFRDNGPGIHKEHMEKLFTPGFSTRGGSGLGLYIARSFIETLKGKLTVEETFVPLGTTFLVELPCEIGRLK